MSRAAFTSFCIHHKARPLGAAAYTELSSHALPEAAALAQALLALEQQAHVSEPLSDRESRASAIALSVL